MEIIRLINNATSLNSIRVILSLRILNFVSNNPMKIFLKRCICTRTKCHFLEFFIIVVEINA